MLLIANWTSVWANQTLAASGQKTGSFIETLAASRTASEAEDGGKRAPISSKPGASITVSFHTHGVRIKLGFHYLALNHVLKKSSEIKSSEINFLNSPGGFK